MQSHPDYSQYSMPELVDALTHLDKDAFPERAQAIQQQILQRSEPDQSESLPEVEYAGFWARWAALLIDTLCLGAIGFVVGVFGGGFFVHLGPWGPAVGLVVAFTYYGLMNSELNHGQTLGKKLMGIRVVSETGALISPLRSVTRYLIFSAPMVLQQLILLIPQWTTVVAYPVTILSCLAYGALIYLYLFNRPSRQVPHDLLCKTLVVKCESEAFQTPPLAKFHLSAIGAIGILSCLFPYWVTSQVPSLSIESLNRARIQLEAQPLVAQAGVVDGQTSGSNNGEAYELTYVQGSLVLTADRIYNQKVARDLARVIVDNYAPAVDRDRIVIELKFGYDIGIWSQWNTQQYQFSLDELAAE